MSTTPPATTPPAAFDLRPSPEPAGEATPRISLFAASAAFFMIVLDTSIVNVALPSIGHQLHADLSALQWIVDGYVVLFAALLLGGGTLSDRLGASRSLTVGLVAFTLASVACGLAPSLMVLITARVLQGAAAAVTLPASLALVRQAYPESGERARAIAIWTAAGGVAVAAGPVLGGLLTAAAGWRAIFFVNLPVGVLGLLALSRVGPSSGRRVDGDAVGQVVVVVAVAALAFGVIEAGAHGLGAPLALGALVVSGVATVLFVWVERRVQAPMVPAALFRSPAVSATAVTGLVLNFAFYGLVFVLSLFFQQTLGASPLTAGLMFVPMTVLIAGSNLFAGRLVRRNGPRLPLVVGQILLVAGLLALLAIDASSPTLLIELLLIPVGIGSGLTIPPLTTAFMDSISPELAGVGAGVLSAARQLGGALGVAVFGALLGSGLTQGLHASLLLAAGSVLVTVVFTVRWVRAGQIGD